MFYGTYVKDTVGNGLTSVTLNSNNPDESHEVSADTGGEKAAGVAAWNNPSTGTQALDALWDAEPNSDGPPPDVIVAYVKGGDTTGWRDVGADHAASTTAVPTFALDTNSDDLVLRFDEEESGSLPEVVTGWTSEQTSSLSSGAYRGRLSSLDSPGSSTSDVVSPGSPFWNGMVAVSIAAAAGGAIFPPNSLVLTGVGR